MTAQTHFHSLSAGQITAWCDPRVTYSMVESASVGNN